jgi:protein tyrosine phosphatase (PTP) superfamily phosphohydrolase (DUF442 family)
MRTSIIIFIFSSLILLCLNTQASIEKADAVEKIKGFKNLYRYQNFYLGGQPSIKELRWLKSQGVNKIINLRSNEENNQYSKDAYNEKSIVEELGFEYYAISVNRTKDYSPKKLKAISSQINDNDIVLLHCRNAVRVTHIFMAYLIKSKGYTINEAVEIGKKLKYSFPLEQLLDIEITMEKR